MVITQTFQLSKCGEFQSPKPPPVQLDTVELRPTRGEYHSFCLQKVQLDWNGEATELYKPQPATQMCALQQAMGYREFFQVTPTMERTKTLHAFSRKDDFESPTVFTSANQSLNNFSYCKPPLKCQNGINQHSVELKSDLLITEISVPFEERQVCTVQCQLPNPRGTFHKPAQQMNQQEKNPFIISSTKGMNKFELNLSASGFFKSLESQACEFLSKQQKELINDSAKSSIEFGSTKKPPKSKKKASKSKKETNKAATSEVAKENVVVSFGNLKSQHAELHSISTASLNSNDSGTPLQKLLPTLSLPFSSEKSLQNKQKRIQFRKYNVEDFLFCFVLGRGSFGKVKKNNLHLKSLLLI